MKASNLKVLKSYFQTFYKLSCQSSSSNLQRCLSTVPFKLSKRSSYIHGSGPFKLVGSTMGEMIDITLERFGDTEAVVDRFQGIRKTFNQFKKEVDEIAMGFLALNLKRGDLLGIWSPNRYEWMLAQMAAAKAGLIVSAINPAYQKMEFEYIFQKVAHRALIIPEMFKTQNYYEMVSDIIPDIKDAISGKINSKKYPHFTSLIMMTDKDLPGVVKFGDLYGAGGSNEKRQLEQLQNEIQMDDELIIVFTSGTTGRPKGAAVSHFGVINNSHHVTSYLNYQKEPHRFVSCLPLFHVFGCVGGSYAAIVSGATCIFPAPSFDPVKILQAIEEERCTSVHGTPTMFMDLVNHSKFKETDISSVSTGIVGGSPVSIQLFQTILHQFDAPGLVNVYGASELSGAATLNRLHSAPLDSVGHVMPNTEVKIVDTKDNIVPVGVSGEVCIRGFQVMKGYWKDAEKTDEVIRDGWYHTGDVGTLAEEGHLTIVGRIKEMIIRGGENIYPREIEDFLSTHPKIANVQVFGVPDKRMGEEVCAWIKLKDNESLSEKEIKEFCRGKIAHFKVPKFIRIVTQFPMTASGKIQKFVMREEMEKLLSSKI